MFASFDPRTFWPFVRLNLIIAAVLSIIFCPSCLTSLRGLWSMVDDFCYSFLISSLLSGGISMIIKFSGKHFSWLENPIKRLLFDIVTVGVYSFMVGFILSSVFCLFVWDNFTFETYDVYAILEATKKPIYISLGITAFFTSRSFLIEWKHTAIEAEKIKNEQLSSKYQGLKDQLNPHFLFNSLNVLSNLVYENADQANAFIEKLSKIYRYVLDVQQEETVSLARELEFARAFLDLQKERFGDKFNYEVDVDNLESYSLPPLSLQLLLENTFKHNKATREEPLKIEIVQDGESLMVRNTLQRRAQEVRASGIGLTNIRERYRFLSDREVEVKSADGFFSVQIPLLQIPSIA